jgi:hypothetical protein
MLELDVALQRFLDEDYPALNTAGRAAFARLLALIRRLIATNLTLGVVTALLGAAGPALSAAMRLA